MPNPTINSLIGTGSGAATGAIVGAISGAGAATGAGAGAGLLASSSAAGPIGLAVGAVVTGILAIFSRHSAAVKNEAAALNSAVPQVQSAWQQIVAAFNSGQISQADASSAIDATLAGYDSLVYGADGVKQKTGNGPAVVKADWLQPWADKLKALLAGGGGTFTSTAIPSHAGFSGLQPFTLSVGAGMTQGESATATLQSALAGGTLDQKLGQMFTSLTGVTVTALPSWVWWVLAAAIAFVIFRRR